MMARRRSLWSVLFLAVGTPVAIYGAVTRTPRPATIAPLAGEARPQGHVTPERERAQRPPAPPRLAVCVTPVTLCAMPPARAGDPCACVHPWRGMVRGHVERIDAQPVLPNSKDWPSDAGADD